VDYYVGCTLNVCSGTPNGAVGKDPTVAANLPSGASYSNHIVTIKANNVKLSDFDFCTPGVNVYVANGVTGTVIENSKFCANNYMLSANEVIAVCGDITCSNESNSDLTLNYNEIDGLMATATTTCCGGYSMESWLRFVSNGNLVIKYDYCHNVSTKCYFIAPNSATVTSFVTFQYNYSVDIGMNTCSVCDHGEETFFWPHNVFNGGDQSFNLSITQKYADRSSSSELSYNWSQGDPTNPSGAQYNSFNMHNNVLINAHGAGYVISFGGGTGDPVSTTGNQWNSNYIDPTGGYGAYYLQNFGGQSGFGGPAWLSSFTGNKNLVTGKPCGARYFNSASGTTTIGDGGSC
jgi:hypothetical protein